MNKYNKTKEILNFSDAHFEDCMFILNYILDLEKENIMLKKQYCERTDCTGRLGNSKKVEELIKENEKLNHYKLLYQKVKVRNDKAIEYVENNTYTSAGSLKTTLYLQNDELYDFLEILKGESNE